MGPKTDAASTRDWLEASKGLKITAHVEAYATMRPGSSLIARNQQTPRRLGAERSVPSGKNSSAAAE